MEGHRKLGVKIGSQHYETPAVPETDEDISMSETMVDPSSQSRERVADQKAIDRLRGRVQEMSAEQLASLQRLLQREVLRREGIRDTGEMVAAVNRAIDVRDDVKPFSLDQPLFTEQYQEDAQRFDATLQTVMSMLNGLPFETFSELVRERKIHPTVIDRLLTAAHEKTFIDPTLTPERFEQLRDLIVKEQGGGSLTDLKKK